MIALAVVFGTQRAGAQQPEERGGRRWRIDAFGASEESGPGGGVLVGVAALRVVHPALALGVAIDGVVIALNREADCFYGTECFGKRIGFGPVIELRLPFESPVAPWVRGGVEVADVETLQNSGIGFGASASAGVDLCLGPVYFGPLVTASRVAHNAHGEFGLGIRFGAAFGR